MMVCRPNNLRKLQKIFITKIFLIYKLYISQFIKIYPEVNSSLILIKLASTKARMYKVLFNFQYFFKQHFFFWCWKLSFLWLTLKIMLKLCAFVDKFLSKSKKNWLWNIIFK